MQTRSSRCGAFVVFAAVALLAGPAWGSTQKTTICHEPPGNPDGAHEIVVSESALEAHLTNHPGDFAGTCQDACQASGACDDGDACTIDLCNVDGSCDRRLRRRRLVHDGSV